jgi:predicted RND superfamily exporter protein
MALFDAPFTIVTQIMPSFLLAVITGASIHLLAMFYKDFAKTGDKKSALRFSMGHSGFAIVMTSLNINAKAKITMSNIFWIKLWVSFLIACLITPANNAEPARCTCDKTFTSIIIDTQTYSSFDKNGKTIVVNEEDEFAEETTNNTPKLYLTDNENTKIIEAVQQITKKYESANFKVHLAGSALFAGVIKQAMRKDTQSIIQKMLLMVIMVLALGK